jgi:hypothetical protein
MIIITTSPIEPCNKRSFDVLLISASAVLSNMYIVVPVQREEGTCELPWNRFGQPNFRALCFTRNRAFQVFNTRFFSLGS